MPTDQRKQSLYFPAHMLEEVRTHARALERSISWVMQRAWRISRRRIAILSPERSNGRPPRYRGVGIEQRIKALLILRGTKPQSAARELEDLQTSLDLAAIAERLEVPVSTLTIGAPWPDVSNDDETPSAHWRTA